MTNILLVAAGGAFGSVLRHLVAIGCVRLFGTGFPAGTLFVNVTGSFLIGFGIEWIARRLGASEALRLLLLTGFLGGYTTFSAFSLDALALAERGSPGVAFAYLIGSVLLGLAAVTAGVVLGRLLG